MREIPENRRDAFHRDALEADVIPLVAAFAVQSHGDARKAIDPRRRFSILPAGLCSIVADPVGVEERV
ncbi:hypothetical protein HISP_15945 [Haloarcula hispanica N601]|uniref:Cdc6 AAA+ ATPase-type lid domain-containing protein n=3 Tax=Haloarcula hispanica TaxID=51589 RepID=V5TT00_HALHI|nr:hypothetical protein HAH_4029 [Haloarcula hispanica ATCC 33960]AHB67825.2 hypothetical protein HISP_15945 [Haloarcula hispanica N601]KAA9401097.1 hypothetical protein Har1131_21115 [Haloarcula sp. CBA1131]MCJ0618169.1 hypothetical protein [Haloarcula hispanica]MUV50005.1 hypothetical protein [Haloarcula sp. CBA1122]